MKESGAILQMEFIRAAFLTKIKIFGKYVLALKVVLIHVKVNVAVKPVEHVIMIFCQQNNIHEQLKEKVQIWNG